MTRFFLIFSFLFISGQAFCQNISNEFVRFYQIGEGKSIADTSYFLINTDYSLNSTAITNNFLLQFAKEGFIDNDLKEEVTRRLKNNNRFGYQLSSGILLKSDLSENTDLLLGLSTRQMSTGAFTADLFNLVFKGNKMFAGKTANISPVDYLSMDYQSLSVGAEKKLTSGKLKIYGGLSLVRGGHLRKLTVENGNLYTEPDGAYIETSMNLKGFITEGKPGFIGTYNGLGASAFAGVTYNNEYSTLNISLSDLGFINYRNVKTYTTDSTIRFEGKVIQNVLTYDDSLFQSYNTDSIIKEVGINVSTQNKTVFIPCIFKINYLYNLSTRFYLLTGVQHIINANYLPRISIRPIYLVNKNLNVHTEISAGGYGKADIEFGISTLLKKNIGINLNLFAAELILARSRTSGHGISFSVVKTL